MNEWERRRYEKSKPAYEALMKVYPFTLDDLEGELWKEFNGYHVSNFGRVKSFKYKKPRILKPRISLDYLRVELCFDGKHKLFSVHRLVALAFIPNPENKPEVNHIDGNKLNNHISNLEWVTASENTRHSVDTGLKIAPQGEEHYKAKLTNEQVQHIRNNPGGLKGCELAKMFGVGRATISEIQHGKKYKKAGGTVHLTKSQIPRLPADIRNQIRAEYVRNSKEFGSYALAKKYGVDHKTILRIIKAK